MNALGEEDGNALHVASFRGDDVTVQLLLEQGANVNAQGGTMGMRCRQLRRQVTTGLFGCCLNTEWT